MTKTNTLALIALLALTAAAQIFVSPQNVILASSGLPITSTTVIAPVGRVVILES